MSLVRSGDARGERPPDRTIPNEGEPMPELREYEVTINGNTTTMQLSDDDAKAYGDAATPVGSKADTPAKAVVEPPKNKARKVR